MAHSIYIKKKRRNTRSLELLLTEKINMSATAHRQPLGNKIELIELALTRESGLKMEACNMDD